MKTLRKNVDDFSSLIHEKIFDKAANLLDEIYSKLRGKLSDSTAVNYVPGINFAYVCPEASTDIFDDLFDMIILHTEFLQSYPELCSSIICQIAAFDFFHFANFYFPQLMLDEPSIRRILALVSRTILDPIHGFLRNAPRSSRNDHWKDHSHRYDFFSSGSPEFETQFGQALIMIRDQLYRVFLKFSESLIKFYEDKPINETIFVVSFTNIIQTVIVPPSYRTFDISCGFPTRLEALFAISQFQDIDIFTKPKSDYFNHTKPIAKQYSELNSQISGFPSNFSDDCVRFSQPFSFANDVNIMLSKLLPFLNLEEANVEAPQFLKLIIYVEAKYSAFFLSLAQLFYLVFPSYSFLIFDEIVNQFTQLSVITPEQNHTLYHMLSRIVDVLGCLPQRYIEDDQIEQLSILGLLGLGSSLPRIRYASFKLIETLGHFEAGEDTIPLSQILKENSGFFEEHLLKHIERDPMMLMSRDTMTPVVPLPMLDAMTSVDCNIWQYMYSTIGIYAAQNFSESMLTKYKQMAIAFVTSQRAKEDHKLKGRIMNTLTFLSALAETPLSNFGEKSKLPLLQKLTNQILDELFKAICNYIDSSYPSIRVLLSPLNISSFPAFLNMMDESIKPEIIALVLRSMTWNINFTAISEHEEFFSLFLDLYIKNFQSFDWGDLRDQIVPEITEKHYRMVNINWIFVSECLMTGYKLLSALYEQQKVQVQAPFPCCDFIVDMTNEFIVKVQPTFYVLINLARMRSGHSRLQTYVIATLTQWAACCQVEDVNFLMNENFYEIIKGITKTSTDILLHLLSHHFELLFPQYIQWAMQPGGSPFFVAISQFFRAPSLTQNTMLSDILRTQWLSCYDIDQSSPFLKYLQTIYENCGSLILCCLFYMNLPDLKLTEQSFILLASLVPVLVLFHMSGRPDDIPLLFDMFLEESRKLEQNTRCLDNQTILGISRNLCTTFSFCMEAVLSAAFDFLPINSQDIVERTLYILMPWFDSIEFDLENRVISNQTELLFMHFSCYSFIDKLMTSFKDFQNLDVNSSFFDVWKTMILTENAINTNFLPIELSILYDCQNQANHTTALQIIRYLYRVAPGEIVSILCSYLSLNKFFYDHTHLSNEAENDISHFLGDDFTEANDKNDLFLFIYQALSKLVLDSSRPIIPYAPLIFASCIIFIDNFLDVIKELLLNILESFKPLVTKESSHMLLEAIQEVQSLSNVHRQLIDRSEMTRNITNFLITYDQQMALDFGHELLKWGICCGDLNRATCALQSYTGNLLDNSMLVVGLISRSMWTVCDAIPIMYQANENTSLYTKYMATALNTLAAMAPNKCTPVDHVILWLALSSLDRNTSLFKEIFDAALNLVSIFLTPQNFSALAGKETPMIGYFPASSFYRFHSPWGDTYHGALPSILNFSGDGNIDLMILVINRLIHTQYIQLLSDSPCAAYTALLALLPWMWHVATTEISRFLFDSIDVQYMELTVNAIEPFVENKDIVSMLASVYMGEDVDVYVVLDTVSEMVVPLVDDEGIAQIGKFYATCAKYADKSYHIPVYSIASKIMKFSQDKLKTAEMLAELSSIILNDTKNSRQLYVNMYLNELPPTMKRQISDPHIKLNFDVQKFPDVPMYERIVAMNIPHLYDVNVNEVQVANFDDLNSFPPLLPNSPSLLSSERFSTVCQLFKKFKCEPFSSYSDILNKLHTALVDVDALNVMKLCEKINTFPILHIFSEALMEYDQKNVQTRDIEEEEILEQPEEFHYEDFITVVTDPYEFVMVTPGSFVPSLDEINCIGLDLMDGMEKF